jgi:hypothetical protein
MCWHLYVYLLLTSVVRTPVGLEDVSRYPYLLAELARSQGWTMNQLEKLAGRNFLRVFRKVEKVNYWKAHGSQGFPRKSARSNTHFAFAI